HVGKTVGLPEMRKAPGITGAQRVQFGDQFCRERNQPVVIGADIRDRFHLTNPRAVDGVADGAVGVVHWLAGRSQLRVDGARVSGSGEAKHHFIGSASVDSPWTKWRPVRKPGEAVALL